MSGAAERPVVRTSIDLAAAAIMVGLTLSWGLNGVAVKFANAGYSPIFLSLARSVIAGVVIYGWCRLRGIPIFQGDGTLIPGLVVGLLFAAEFILLFVSLDHTSVARSTLMLNTMPFWVLVGAHFLLGERMSLIKVGGLVLAFCGVIAVFFDQLSLPGPDARWGDLLSLGAGMFWAATILAIKATGLSRASAEKLLLYQLAVAAVVSAAILPFTGPAFREVTTTATAALLFQALYVVAFSYLVWFWLMRRYPAAGLSSFVFLTPAFGVLFGGLILGEPLSGRLYGALFLIAAGLFLVNRPARTHLA